MASFNGILFPAPPSSYDANNCHLIMVQHNINNLASSNNITINQDQSNANKNNKESQNKSRQIPCWLESYESDLLLLFFHGNAEDIGISADFMVYIATHLKMNVLAVEYPGYGIYNGKKSATTMLEDAETVYDYITLERKILPQNIFVLGRSIGSGPATHLAATRQCKALILMSPYTSIKKLVKDIVGFLSFVVAERFKNYEKILAVKSPILFIHGEKDTLIRPKHSQEMHNSCKINNQDCELQIRKDMTHNDFNLIYDFVNPILEFIKKYDLMKDSDKTVKKINLQTDSEMKQYNLNEENIIQRKLTQ